MSMFRLPYPQLCLITDPTMPDLVQKVARALDAGITMLQVRGHSLTPVQLYALATVLRPLCQQHQATFIVNDRVDIGLATGANGFQLGRHSLPLSAVRQMVGKDYLLGASVHSLAEAQEAVTNGADFLLAGTIFASHSHPGEPTSGTALLRAIKREGIDCPFLAIGGITGSNAEQVMEAGADGIAVISAVLGAANVEQAVGELRRRIGLQ